MKRALLVLAAALGLSMASTPALAGHSPGPSGGPDYCRDTAENPDWIIGMRVSESVVPGNPRPGQTLHFRINAYRNVNHFEAKPSVHFTDAATGEKTITELPDKHTEPGERQRLVWPFTVPSPGTVTIEYHAVWFCSGTSYEHGDGGGATGTFEVRHPV